MFVQKTFYGVPFECMCSMTQTRQMNGTCIKGEKRPTTNIEKIFVPVKLLMAKI